MKSPRGQARLVPSRRADLETDMTTTYEFELHKAALILARDMLRLKQGEILVVTADTQSDPRVVQAAAAAAHALGAIPMVITLASPLGVGKAADPLPPGEARRAALGE